MTERFLREGQLAAGLDHPRCVYVHEARNDGRTPFLVMELVDGSDLAEVVRESGPLDYETAIRHVLDVLDGLDALHRCGVIHRDIKPANCFRGADGRAKLGDFGLSRVLSGSDAATREERFVGTPMFAAPEQLSGREVDERTDIYAVAATLFCLISGRAPVTRASYEGAVAAALEGDVERLRVEVPKGLETLLLRALSVDAERRPASAMAFAAELKRFLPEHLESAGGLERLAAFVVDAAILFVVAHVANAIVGGNHAMGLYQPLVWSSVALFVAVSSYFAAFEGGRLAASPGKAMLGLRVLRNGSVLDAGRVRAGRRALVGSTIYASGIGLTLWLPDSIAALGPLSFGSMMMLRIFTLPFALSVPALWGGRTTIDVMTATRVVRLAESLPALSIDTMLAAAKDWCGEARAQLRRFESSAHDALLLPYGELRAQFASELRSPPRIRDFEAIDPVELRDLHWGLLTVALVTRPLEQKVVLDANRLPRLEPLDAFLDRFDGAWGWRVPYRGLLIGGGILVVLGGVTRGGLSARLAGFVLVDRRNRRMTVVRALLRSALIWFPLTAIAVAAEWIAIHVPERIVWSGVLYHAAAFAIALGPVSVALGRRRTRLDRWSGSWAVPR